MPKYKRLHMAKSIEELEKQVNLPNLKNYRTKLLCNTAAKILDEAERCELMGDQEMSYIFYLRYFTTIMEIRKSPEYKSPSRRAEVSDILGSQTKQLNAMTALEELKTCLQARYEELKNSEAVDARATSDSASQSNERVDLRDEPSVRIEPEVPVSGTISCTDLHEALYANESILLIDCRPAQDYARSRLKVGNYLHIPEEKITLGMSASKIGFVLTNADDQALWLSRGSRSRIVLMDWNGSGPDARRALWILKDIMETWDPNVVYRSIAVLDGGYELYILMYPMDSTNPNVSAPVAITKRDDNLDDIEYPSLNDITMKDRSAYETEEVPSAGRKSASTGRPVIDRGSKAAAMTTYKRRDFLREQHQITEKVLASQKQILNEENELVEIMKRRNGDQGARMPDALAVADDNKENQINETMFKILQLDNTIDDALMKKKMAVDQESTETAAAVEEEEEEDEAERLENLRMAESIRSKELEIRRMQEIREKIAAEREEKLRLAKAQKRYLQPRQDENRAPPPPVAKVHPVPQVDRSVKPAATVVKRDFAPVFGQVGLGLTGLKNLGNTCYMNSIMQCLSNTSPLVEYFYTDMYRRHINVGNATEGRVVKEVAALIRELWSGQCRYIASKDLRRIVGQYQQEFSGIDQQDSHEFLTILIDWLHSDLQTLQSSVMINPALKLPPSDKSWLEHTKSKESNIFRLFYGQIKSTVKCKVCLNESATYDCFSNLSLELPPKNNRCSLNRCFDMYFNGETVTDWDCPNCKQKRDAIKKLDISRLPPVLVIHFKRFYADTDYGSSTYKKKTNFIDFPVNRLDIEEYVARSERRQNAHLQTSYNLYATSNHYGSMESGHYTAFCRNNLLGDWYKYDDHTVSRMDQSDVVTSGAYILFYTNLPDAPLPIFK